MRVKKLDLFGFKSFASRQSLIFGEGITGVVGPNGCGKSNVVDALRWVMGEQNARHLRGSNMQDIIFCGSEKKSPLGFAEVTLTLENHDHKAPLEYNHYEEIQITRRLYKSGESEYEINKQKARLKDISDFFLGTGVGTKAYSIIEQGRINEVISAKPIERRLMIEEAAGITKYKAKKALAEKRMEATRQNLDRIVDIRNEVEKRVSILAKEKAKLLELQNLKARFLKLDLHVASHRYLDFNARLSFLSKHRDQIDLTVNELKREIAFKEQAFSSVLEDYANKFEERRVLEELKIKQQNTQELLRKDQDYAQKTLAENQSFLSRVTMQLADLAVRDQELLEQIRRLDTEQDMSKNQLLEINGKISQQQENGQGVILSRQHCLVKERDIQAKIIQESSTAARLQAQISAEEEKEALKKNEILSLGSDIALKEQEVNEKMNFIVALSKEYELAKENEAHLEKSLKLKEEEKSSLLQKIKDETEAFNHQEEEISAINLRLNSLYEIDQQLDWSESGVAALRNSNPSLIKSVLADVMSVKPGYEELVEKCLMNMLDTALIENIDDLKQAISLLKTEKAPLTSFFILTDQAKPELPTFSPLISLETYIDISDKNYDSLRLLLARYFVADNLDCALAHWEKSKLNQCQIITKDGELLLSDGRAIILGVKSQQGVLKRKNEQKELETKLEHLKKELAQKHELLLDKREMLKALEQCSKDLQDELKPLSVGLVRLEESIKQKESDVKRVEAELERLFEKRDNLLDYADHDDNKQSELKKLWSHALSNHRDLTEELSAIKDLQIKAEEDYELYLSELKSLEVKKAGLEEKVLGHETLLTDAKKNLMLICTQKESLEEQAYEKNDDELKLHELAKEASKKIEDIKDELIKIDNQLKDTLIRCQVLDEQKQAHELQLAGFKEELQECSKTIHNNELSIRDLHNELKNISERIKERHRVNLLEHITDYHKEPIDEALAKVQMDDLKRALDRMGSINENAEIEYDEFKNRHDFLTDQINDLEDALTQLSSAINKINKTTRMRFEEAFNGINKHFKVVFPRLFNGGRAELILTNQDDLLTAGVDILAKPPGKNIGSIELLSGGEKALTAISLVMAIFLIKPSPFCLLDEVDAPLDEANVARFGQLIKEMSARSQFIVITHNRKTMESADQLYGVTMEDAGSSKVVSVAVQQAYLSIKEEANNRAKNSQIPLENPS